MISCTMHDARQARIHRTPHPQLLRTQQLPSIEISAKEEHRGGVRYMQVRNRFGAPRTSATKDG
jgi:hypothetical protein